MKPSYKFKWHRGDHYAYCGVTVRGMTMSTETEAEWAMTMSTEMEAEWAMEPQTAAHNSWIWSSRKVSK